VDAEHRSHVISATPFSQKNAAGTAGAKASVSFSW
jgi:hypothetical protein